MSERPLLTLAICCYKFERFIDEALDGAFAQTYRPLEIVVSDDCSPDGSWQHILDKVATRFPDAPLDRQANCQTLVLSDPPSTSSPTSQTSPNFLSLTLNRNPTNLGLARHENRLFELSHGEWIAFQSGDDVSMPHRMQTIADAVIANPGIRCLHCRCDVIDAKGKIVGWQDESIHKNKSLLPYVLGAGAVYHRDVFSEFGPLSSRVCNEDHVLPLRAKLLGSIYFIASPVVQYRKHDGNLSGNDLVTCKNPENDARYRLGLVYAYYQELIDIHHAQIDKLADWRFVNRVREEIEQRIFSMTFLGNWCLHPEMRWNLLIRLFGSCHHMLFFIRQVMSHMFRRNIGGA